MAVNKVIKSDGTTLIDITGTTATASDVASGKVFFASDGTQTTGTASGGVTRTNIVPEQTVTGSGYLALSASEVIVAEQNYAYTFDGEERIGTAVAANGNVYLGDVDAFWGNTGGAFVTDGLTMYVVANVDGSHTVKIDKITENSGGGGGSTNPLSGKILSTTGDSITAGAGNNGTGYPEIVASDNSMTLQNVAVGGGTVAYINANTFCISRSISSMRSDADFVLLEGGGNDADSGVPLGTLSSGYTATLDDTTFAGAIESMFKAALARFPDKKIGYVFIHKCASLFDSRVSNSYYDMAKAACEKWGIPYLDLNTQVPPLNYIADLKSTYTANADGYHPNELGYRTFYVPKITAFLNTMLTDNSLINKTVTANGTYLASDDNADGYSSVTVNVAGGASNIVTGTFKGTTTGAAMDVDLAYTGNGYPLNVMIYPVEGAYDANSTIYTLLQRYCTLLYVAIKDYTSTAPDYNGTGTDDQYTTFNRYKNSASNYTTYGQNVSVSNPIANGGNALATGSGKYVVSFKAKNKMSVYIASTLYGFPANIEFKYQIIYSS